MSSLTVIRVIIPLVAALGAFFGAMFGLVKLLPERANIITGYQLKQIEALQKQNGEQAEEILSLKNERRSQAHSIGNLEQELEAVKFKLEKALGVLANRGQAI